MSTPLNSSLLKGFDVLGLFSENIREISAALIVERLGMNNATAHRFLVTLESAGALRSTKRGYYALGPTVEKLGQMAEETGSRSMALAPEIEALSREVGESVMACRMTRHGPTCIAVARSNRPISVDINVGTLLPAFRSAQGKIWLAEMTPGERRRKIQALTQARAEAEAPDLDALDDELRDIREQGYALNLGDNEPDLAAVSVPVRNEAGKLVLTLSVFGMLSRFDENLLRLACSKLTKNAKLIGAKF